MVFNFLYFWNLQCSYYHYMKSEGILLRIKEMIETGVEEQDFIILV